MQAYSSEQKRMYDAPPLNTYGRQGLFIADTVARVASVTDKNWFSKMFGRYIRFHHDGDSPPNWFPRNIYTEEMPPVHEPCSKFAYTAINRTPCSEPP